MDKIYQKKRERLLNSIEFKKVDRFPINGGNGTIAALEKITGRIYPGYCADFVLLHNRFLDYSPGEIHQSLPLAVMMDGNWVYKNDKIDLE